MQTAINSIHETHNFEQSRYVNMYRKRNYMFALDDVYTVDAGTLGNETRFINHAVNGEESGSALSANCIARRKSLDPWV